MYLRIQIISSNYINKFMKKLILIFALFIFSNTIIAQDAEPEAPTSTERVKLPSQFSKLPGKWQFNKALQNGKNVSADLKMFFINKEPITLIFEKEGKISYPSEAETALKIKEGYWEYVPGGKRDFKIKTIMEGGSAEQNYTLVSVSEKEMIYEETRSKTKYYFKRIK